MDAPLIYLDYNATTPLAPGVADAMRPFLTGLFGNPSSEHRLGAEAKRALEAARRKVASCVGALSEEIVFTSGGTEANNLAIKGLAHAHRAGRRHIVYSAVEHPAVSEVVLQLEREGFRVSKLPVDDAGRVRPGDVTAAIDEDTLLVSVMFANNEVGTIQSIAEIAEIAHANGAYVHTDAAQAVGKIETNVDSLGVDLLSIAGHKLYAPKGVGALYIRTGTVITNQTHGANHEHGLRPGTENVMFAVALGQACAEVGDTLRNEIPRITSLRDYFEERVLEHFGPSRARVNAVAARRLPNTSSISLKGIEANVLIAEIGSRVAASAGAACHAGAVDISSVLSAMRIPEEWAMGTIRFSMGIGTSREEVDKAASVLFEAADRITGKHDFVVERALSETETKLTRFTQGMGCACKIRPQVLENVLARLSIRPDPNVLVDMSTSDDAGVYRISDDTALVQTVDFLTPIVDDPYSFGSIAASNALSDVYAMGARPLYAVNIVGFPSQRLSDDVLYDILRGAADKCAEAGISIIGGHTIEDTEPKFGLAVTGAVDPARILRNVGAKAGDALILTKPLGTGIIATGLKRGVAEESDSSELTATMAELNKVASEALSQYPVTACTDITGFGLLGHLLEMTVGSTVDVEISVSKVPFLAAARRLASAGVVPGGTRDNLNHVGPHVSFERQIPESTKWLLADAQTSGGLLISLPQESARLLLHHLHELGIETAAEIGVVTGDGLGAIAVVH